MSKNRGTIPIPIPITVVFSVIVAFMAWNHPAGLSSDVLQKSICQSSETGIPTLTQQQAEELVRQWMIAKSQIFSRRSSLKKARELSTGRLYQDLTEPRKLKLTRF